MQEKASGATFREITKTKFAELEIPLPPLEVQRELVAEIEGYQQVVDGLRQAIDKWKPQIATDLDWQTVELGDEELFQIESGGTPKSGVQAHWDGGVPMDYTGGSTCCERRHGNCQHRVDHQ